MQILLWIILLGNVVCLLKTCFKMLEVEGSTHALLGFIIGIYAFVWGWRMVRSGYDKKFMVIWSIFLILSLTSQMILS